MRLETGTVQCGDDWPGVFIRGDAALMAYSLPLKRLIEGEGTEMDKAILTGLLNLLQGADASIAKPQKVELADPKAK